MIVLLAAIVVWGSTTVSADDGRRIQPYAKRPFYWQYQGELILLLGASDYHNIF
jgi:hypothetical protein